MVPHKLTFKEQYANAKNAEINVGNFWKWGYEKF